MGYLDDLQTISNAMRHAKDTVDKQQRKSIARGALDGTMQFPCLVSDAISIDMASTIARTLERVYASFIQTYLSLNNTIDISVDKNPSQFLQKYHRNVKLEATAEDVYAEHCVDYSSDEFNSLMDRIYDGTTKAYMNESSNELIVFNFSDKLNRSVYESNKELLEEHLASIDFNPFPNIGNSPFYEANGNPGGSPHPAFSMNQYRDTARIDSNYSLRNDAIKSGMGLASNLITGAINSADNRRRDDLKYQRDIERDNVKYQRDMDKQKFVMKNGGNVNPPTLLKDSDIKKQNDLQPYNMQVRLMAVNSENEFVQFMDFVVGIKVVLHNIKSDEMITNLQNALQNNGKLFNFIRWTTGEKSLIKDLLLHINDVKLDVANRSQGASRWWVTLKRMKNTASAQKAILAKNQLIPNSTIVISSYDADIIQKNFGYDLRNPKFADKLMKSLFLMAFVIIDDGTRTIDILYDGETSYQTYALETLEREISMNSNKIGKELTRMISR